MRAVARKHCRRFGILDPAFSLKKENDYTALGAFAVTPRMDLVVLDIHRERMEGPDIPRAVEALVKKWDLAYVGVEAQQAQVILVQQLRRRGLSIRAIRAEADKLSRAITATVRMESGQVFLPESAHWLDDFVAELLGFPHAAHDDQVDVLAYACIEVMKFGAPAEPPGYTELREYAERELAQKHWEEVDNPLLWEGDEDDAWN